MPWLCCAAGRQTPREGAYGAAPEADPKKYTWEERDDSDVERFKVERAESCVVLRDRVDGQHCAIENCKDSVILVLDHSAAVNVDDCENCLIVIGPCRGSVFIRDCSGCQVVTACQQLRTRDCARLGISLLCATQPIIESSQQVAFHPLALDYPMLNDHMRLAGLHGFYSRKDAHDFTPEDGPHHKQYTEPLQLKKQLEYMLAGDSNGVCLVPSLSAFPPFATAHANQEKEWMFAACNEGDDHAAFRELALASLRQMVVDGRRLIRCAAVSASKEDVELLITPPASFLKGELLFACTQGDGQVTGEWKRAGAEDGDIVPLLATLASQ